MSVFDLLDDAAIHRLQKHAAEAQTVPLMFTKFDAGVWTIGGENVTDSLWLALTDMATIGWKLFIDNRMVEEHMVLLLENDAPKRPDSHTDKSRWPTGPRGRPSDPWRRQYSLLLMNEETGQVVAFNAASALAKTAIGALLDDFATTRRRPIVALSSETVRSDSGKDVLHPLFAITDHSENDTPIKGIAVEKDIIHPAGIKPNDGMDDSIPF